MKIHFDKVNELEGFSLGNGKKGEKVNILSRAALTSVDTSFYIYSESFSNIFLRDVVINNIYQYLIIIHNDLSADLYVNDFPTAIQIRAKRDVKAGQAINQNHIADIAEMAFPAIEINETDKIIYCFKVGWRFGLFFDLATKSLDPNGAKLDVKKTMQMIGSIYRYLLFYHVYKQLESNKVFKQIMQDGWFPFIEILNREYKLLSDAYNNPFNFESRIREIVENFDEKRVKDITNGWWKNPVFLEKKELIEAGINAFLQNTSDGYINAIKNLWTEIEGVLRIIYHLETRKGNNVKAKDFIGHIIQKGKNKTSSEQSLFLPTHFLNYLNDIAFANFDVEQNDVSLSRNSSSHGVASKDQYTKVRALQLILILDQIHFFT